MDLKRYLEAMREFKEREGYYPNFGQMRQEQEEQEAQPEPEQPTRRQWIVPRKRRRPWK